MQIVSSVGGADLNIRSVPLDTFDGCKSRWKRATGAKIHVARQDTPVATILAAGGASRMKGSMGEGRHLARGGRGKGASVASRVGAAPKSGTFSELPRDL